MQKALVDIPRTSLDIYNYQEDGSNIYEFDATECSAPEPMLNTIAALEVLKNQNDLLKVLFFHEPIPLYQKVSQKFSYESQEQKNGDFLVIFRIK